MALTRAQKLENFLDKENQKKKSKFSTLKRASEVGDIEYIKTGNPGFDIVFGGFARGRHTMLYGGPGGGKTSFVLETIADLQKRGIAVAFYESETTFDKQWAKKLGVDLEHLILSEETGFGAVLDSVISLTRSGMVDIIFIDSLAALKVKEIDKDDFGVEDKTMAIIARNLSQNYFPKINEIMAKTGTAVVYTTQKRSSMDPNSTNIDEYTGGNALKHHLSLAVNIRRCSPKKVLSDDGARFQGPDPMQKLGFAVNARCIKTKTGIVRENQNVVMSFMFGKGFDKVITVLDMAKQYDVLKKAGKAGHYIATLINGRKYEQTGLSNVENDLRNDKELLEELTLTIRKSVESFDQLPEVESETDTSTDTNPDQAAESGGAGEADTKEQKPD